MLGHHQCPGMKVAPPLIKLVITLLLAGCDLHLVDSAGNYPNTSPKPDWNDLHVVCWLPNSYCFDLTAIFHKKPLGDPYFLEFKRIST
jgi:hypothetical protein